MRSVVTAPETKTKDPLSSVQNIRPSDSEEQLLNSGDESIGVESAKSELHLILSVNRALRTNILVAKVKLSV